MSKIRLKYVDRFTDRHGSVRYYFRRGKGARVPLPGLPGSSEFMEAYQSAVDGIEPPKVKKQRGEPGTIDRLVSEYFQSPEFLRLKEATQGQYRSVIEKWVRDENVGHRSVAGLRREHVKSMMGKRAGKPGAAAYFLQTAHVLMKYAIDNGWRSDDPTVGVKRFKLGEYHTWADSEIEAFEAKWPIGSTERLAFSLLLYTGQRRSDVIRMSWRDIDNGVIQVTQQKTGNKVWIPLHANLADILDRTEKKHLAILTTVKEKTFSPGGFSMWMAKRVAAAGLPEKCVSHGIRKAAARRLAEAGCSAHEIASITGHKSLSEVERYTRAVDQKRLAVAAVKRLTEHE